MPVRFSARRTARGIAITAIALMYLLAAGRHGLEAKAPGVTHCYKGVCHRVRTLEETRMLLGSTLVMAASHYDFPWSDRYNAGVFTSNGERFDAGDPDRVSSSDLPDGTELLLRNPENGRVSHVRVNDFGPFHGDRLLDVTRRVAEDLGFAKRGVTDLEVTIIALPRSEDLTYRRNRPRTLAMGPLGNFGEADMPALITRKLEARSPDEAGRIIMATPLNLRIPNAAPDAAMAADPVMAAVADAHTKIEPAPTPQPHHGLWAAAPEVRAESTLMTTSSRLPHVSLGMAQPPSPVEDVAATEPDTPVPDTPRPVVSTASVLATTTGGQDERDSLLQPAAMPASVVEPRVSAGLSTTVSGLAAATATAKLSRQSIVPQPMSRQALLLLMMMVLTMAAIAAVWHPIGTSTAAARNHGLTRSTSKSHGEMATTYAARHSVPPQAEAQRPSIPAAFDTHTATPAHPQQPTSLLDASLTLKGTLRAAGCIAIAGQVEGRIEAGSIEILQGAHVQAALIADEIFIDGDVAGPITARVVTIGPNARVVSEITCQVISIRETAWVEAEVRRPRLMLQT